MTTTLLEARVALQKAKPDEVKITPLPNGNLQIEIVAPQHHAQKTITESKWAKFADEMHRKSPLRGKSEQVNTLIKQFRNKFSVVGCGLPHQTSIGGESLH